jgi:hypothetical protein
MRALKQNPPGLVKANQRKMKLGRQLIVANCALRRGCARRSLFDVTAVSETAL